MPHPHFPRIEPHCWHSYTERHTTSKVHGPFIYDANGKSYAQPTSNYKVEPYHIIEELEYCCKCNKARSLSKRIVSPDYVAPPPPLRPVMPDPGVKLKL